MTTRSRIKGRHTRFGTSVKFQLNIEIAFVRARIRVRLRTVDIRRDTAADHTK